MVPALLSLPSLGGFGLSSTKQFKGETGDVNFGDKDFTVNKGITPVQIAIGAGAALVGFLLLRGR
ncbi:MAG: hypothetical protein ACX939_10195 [Hyphococcus sp.]